MLYLLDHPRLVIALVALTAITFLVVAWSAGHDLNNDNDSSTP